MRKRWLPLVVIWVGILWLAQSMISEQHGVLLLPQKADLGSIPTGTARSVKIALINLSARQLDVNVEPSCGCTVAELSEGVLEPLQLRRFAVQVGTDGMIPGVHKRVVRLRFRRGDAQWTQEIWFRFRVPMTPVP